MTTTNTPDGDELPKTMFDKTIGVQIDLSKYGLKEEFMQWHQKQLDAAVLEARLDEVTLMVAIGFSYAGKLKRGDYTEREMIEAYRNLCLAYEKHLTKRSADLTGPEWPDLRQQAESGDEEEI